MYDHTTIKRPKLWRYDCCWYSVFFNIDSGIPTTHQVNITVVVGIWFTTVIKRIIEDIFSLVHIIAATYK